MLVSAADPSAIGLISAPVIAEGIEEFVGSRFMTMDRYFS